MKHANKFNTAKFSNNQRIGNNLSEKQELAIIGSVIVILIANILNLIIN